MASIALKYLLFEGTYDGSQADYLQGFADILRRSHRAMGCLLWIRFRDSARPGPQRPTASGFQDFVELTP